MMSRFPTFFARNRPFAKSSNTRVRETTPLVILGMSSRAYPKTGVETNRRPSRPPQNLSECRRTTPEAVEFEGVLKELKGPRVHQLCPASALSGDISPTGVAIGPHHVGGNVFAIQSNLAQRGDLVVVPAGPAAYKVRD